MQVDPGSLIHGAVVLVSGVTPPREGEATVVENIGKDRNAHGLLQWQEGVDETHEGRYHPVGFHGGVVVSHPELHMWSAHVAGGPHDVTQAG